MSLRVLLADESDTIKKVFQLALQDFDAEVKGVHSGLDVIDVALAFKPDIIFADVLLQKKNGYDTCLELKQHPKLKDIPVVLMWSSFMELDQSQFKRSQANDQLEKPFDADFLRNLVKKYTPEAEESPMAQFLNFPKSITAPLKPSSPPPKEESMNFSLPELTNSEDASEFNKTSAGTALTPTPTPMIKGGAKSLFEDLKAPASLSPSLPSLTPEEPAGESWKSTDISKFQITNDNDNLDKFEALNTQTPAENEDDEKTDDFSQVAVASLNEIMSFDEELKRINDNPSVKLDKFSEAEPSKPTTPPTGSVTRAPASAPPSQSSTAIAGTPQEIEAIVRAHTEEFIKTEIKPYLLEAIERIVREELNKILEEEVHLKQELSSDQP